jgi:hypothetical protein
LNKRASSALGKKLSIYEIVAKKIKNGGKKYIL